MTWLKLTPDAAVPKREMEVAMLVAPAASHVKKPSLQPQSRMVRSPRSHVEQPVPELPQPVAAMFGERDVPIVVTGSPPSATASVVQPVAQEVKPDFAASYLSNRLNYPLLARRMGIQGRVVLDVEVLADGLCGQTGIAQSSGHEMLDRAALESVKSWHFVPARHGTQAVTRWFKVPITFSLKDDEA